MARAIFGSVDRLTFQGLGVDCERLLRENFAKFREKWGPGRTAGYRPPPPAMPLTANGKVDRLTLPEPNAENTLRDEEFIRPRTSIEQRLAATLCSLLNLSEVSVSDNFFLLGGHSLLGTQLIVKIRSTFGVDLALRTLFDAPTIAELSTAIEQQIVSKVENMSEEEAQRLLA